MIFGQFGCFRDNKREFESTGEDCTKTDETSTLNLQASSDSTADLRLCFQRLVTPDISNFFGIIQKE